MKYAVCPHALCRTPDGQPQFAFDNEAIFYYRSGHVSERAFYSVSKLQGEVIDYNEDGTVRNSDYYEDGRLIDKRRFAVGPVHPLLGTWRRKPLAGAFPRDVTWTFTPMESLRAVFSTRCSRSSSPPRSKRTGSISLQMPRAAFSNRIREMSLH